LPVHSAYRPDPRHLSLGDDYYDIVRPAAFPAAILRFRNQRHAARIGLGDLTPAEWEAHFHRFEPLPGNIPQPLALRYHGHQFRAWNPDLGDGRGFLFAQMRDAGGRLLDLGTKGSGQTPWSRAGDGRLTLKGGVREVLATEMLEALGVYTSKTFSLFETGEALWRGDEPSPTRSSVMVRLSHSHVRIGTFQRFAALGEADNLKKLLDYSIATYWPQIDGATDRAAAFVAAVSGAVAAMAAEWFAAGFVHGVLNTDNTTITGESFDYGPWRFLPVLNTRFTAAYFDQTGLYAFGRQPGALHWNLARLAECLIHLSSQTEMEAALTVFEQVFDAAVVARTLARLGLSAAGVENAGATVGAFYREMARSKVPFERCFFDLVGIDRARIATSPHAGLYAEPDFATVIGALADLPKAAGLPAALAHPHFADNAPTTMLIDQVEALWAPIAEADDWSAFEATVAAIRRMGEAQAPLLSPLSRLPAAYAA
jgi:uncharacterized protein YdiU (UPF0061 family)